MKLQIVTSVVALLLSGSLWAQNYTVSGTVTDQESGQPVDFATVVLTSSEQWAVANAKGEFTIKNVSAGDNVLSVSCLGYVTVTRDLSVNGNITDLKVSLVLDNLRLESAVVTAQENSNSAATSRTIDKTALEHVQVMNVTDIGGLLPGGKTGASTLTTSRWTASGLRTTPPSRACPASRPTTSPLPTWSPWRSSQVCPPWNTAT